MELILRIMSQAASADILLPRRGGALEVIEPVRSNRGPPLEGLSRGVALGVQAGDEASGDGAEAGALRTALGA